jgi:3-dehydroquinate dehydratase type I
MNKTPSKDDLADLLKKMAATGADVIKIVTKAKSVEDNLRILDLIPNARTLGVEIIALAMGPHGKMSRIMSPLLGAYLTFASLEAGQESASGQIPANEIKQILNRLSP